MDMRSYVSQSDLIYNGRIACGAYGIPVAGGSFGGPIWQENENVLMMQLNHTDTFMYNDASANTAPESGALGLLRIDLGGPCFQGSVGQHLHLYDGILDIVCEEITVQAIAGFENDTVCIRITDQRKEPKEIKVSLSMCREPEVVRGNFRAVSRFDREKLGENMLLLSQLFEEKCDTDIAENDHYCATAVAVEVHGGRLLRAGNDADSCYVQTAAQNGSIEVILSGISTLQKGIDVGKRASAILKETKGYHSIAEQTGRFLAEFYRKSYIDIPGHREFQQRWTYFMYLSLISNRGNFPSKFNGGNWIGLGDRRDWGCWYWNWNQDSVYQPLNSANHTELMEPMFKMRERSLEHYRLAARQCFGIQNPDAIFIGETVGILGAERLPENIAADLADYMNGISPLTERLKAFGDRRESFLTPMNWNWDSLEKSSVNYVTHTLVATQENADYYWQRYCYTKDINFLRERAYPFIKGAAELYRSYPGFVKEKDGYYHFNRTNLHEHIWGGRDVIDDLSLARGIFPTAIRAAEILDVDLELRKKWKECYEHLAPYPMYQEEGTIGCVIKDPGDRPVWMPGREPAVKQRGLNGTESPRLKMLEKFDVLNLESRDQETDNGDFQTALNTFYVMPGYQNLYILEKEDRSGTARFLEDAAKLGRSEELKKMFCTQYKMFQNTPNLLEQQGDFFSIEGYGTFAMALQQALLQSLAPVPGGAHVIRVFPAWPREWDVSFRLLAKGGFVVETSLKDGEIPSVNIESQLGEILRFRSPYEGKVRIESSRGTVKEFLCGRNEKISLETKKGELLCIKRGEQDNGKQKITSR